MLATHIWGEETAQIEDEEEEEQQKERCTKKNLGHRKQQRKGTKPSERGECEATKEEGTMARSQTWDIHIAHKEKAREVLVDLGFNYKAEVSGREARIRKEEEISEKPGRI